MVRNFIQLFCLAGLFMVLNPAYGEYYSQSGQDRFIHEHFFRDKRDGVFVEIGAYDGRTYSNTYFFEKNLGWKGICIEPVPSVFEKLQKNRNCICVNGCISNVNSKAEFLEVIGAPQMLSGLADKYDPRHIERINREIARDGGDLKKIEVNCYTLEEILRRNGFDHIDYLSIDTEGNEFEIIKSIDFKAIDIDIISVEENYGDHGMIEWMRKLGYSCETVLGGDLVFKKEKNV